MRRQLWGGLQTGSVSPGRDEIVLTVGSDPFDVDVGWVFLLPDVTAGKYFVDIHTQKMYIFANSGKINHQVIPCG